MHLGKLVIVFRTLFLVFLFSSCHFNSKDLSSQKDITDLMMLNILYSGTTTLKDSLILHTVDGTVIKFKDLKNSDSRVFLRLTENNCNSCYEEELTKLKELSKTIGNSKIALLVSFSEDKYVKLFAKNYQLNFPIYNIKLSSFSYNRIENLNRPYLFVVNTSNICENIFIPDPKFANISSNYYEKIKLLLK